MLGKKIKKHIFKHDVYVLETGVFRAMCYNPVEGGEVRAVKSSLFFKERRNICQPGILTDFPGGCSRFS